MTHTESYTTTVLAALLALTVLTASPALAAQDNSNKRLDVTLEEGENGETVSLVLGSSLGSVSGMETVIEYNSDVVQFKSAQAVDLDDSALLNVNDDQGKFSSSGKLKVSHAAPTSKAVDQPTMSKLTFEVVGDGEMNFNFVDSTTEVYEVVNGEPVSLNIETMSVSMSTDQLSNTGDSTGDSSDGASTGGSSSDGSNSDGASTGDSSGSDGASDSSGDSGQSSGESGQNNAGENTANNQNGNGQSDAESAGGGSSLVSGVGMLAVVAGFLFAVAMLARDQM